MKTIYLDMDGVLADFDKHCIELIGRTVHSFADSQDGWNALGDHRLEMYRHLEPFQDAEDLVLAVHGLAGAYGYGIGVLTAVPKLGRVPLAKQHKKEWLETHFPVLLQNFNIGPWAQDKFKHCVPGDILIDDSALNVAQWAEAGGIGILHVTAAQTITELERHLGAATRSSNAPLVVEF